MKKIELNDIQKFLIEIAVTNAEDLPRNTPLTLETIFGKEVWFETNEDEHKIYGREFSKLEQAGLVPFKRDKNTSANAAQYVRR